MNTTCEVRVLFVEGVYHTCLDFPNEMADHKRTIAAEQFDDKRPELWSVAVKSKWNPRFRDWIWVSSMLWVACGVVITSYIFYSTTAPYESADVMGTGIIGISAGPAAVQITAVLASGVWALIPIPVAMGGLIRLSRHQRNNWLRAFVWICAWVAGTGLCVGTLVESELGRAATLFRLARAWVLDVSDSDGEIVAQTFGERGLR